jgi:hypothetical protein
MSVDAVNVFVASPMARASKTRQFQQHSRDRSAEGDAIVLATSISALDGRRPLASSQSPFLAARRTPSKPNGERYAPNDLTHYGAGLRPFDRGAQSALPIDWHEAAIPADSDPRREYAMSSKTTITNRPSHRLFAVTKAEGQDKASWLEIGAAWPNKDGKGFSLKLKAMPMPGSEIVLRIVAPSEATT